jgi:hypothetical protein
MKTETLMLVIAIYTTPAHAGPTLQPTQVSTGDCVAARITEEETGTAFFTNRCSESDFFVALNGVTYILHRISGPTKNTLWYEGDFAGEGLDVNVALASRRIRKCDELSLAQMKSLSIAGPHRVTVKVRRNTDAVRINGIFDDCP